MTIIATPAGFLRVHFKAETQQPGAEMLYFGVLQDGRFVVASRDRCEIVTPDRQKALEIFRRRTRSTEGHRTTGGGSGDG